MTFGYRCSRKITAAVAAGVLLAFPVLSPSVTAAAAPSTAAPSTSAPSACPWVASHAPPAQRAEQLLRAMTLDEKVGMMDLNASADGYENVTTAVPSLCVPRLVLQDGPAGITAGPAGSHTQLPAPIDVGASFDPTVAKSYGTVQGEEAMAKGIDVVQGPDVNIARVPQSGRNFEAYGEDPYLSSQLGVANIDGIQGTGESADLKHFDAYNQEANRNTAADDDIVSDRVLHEIYMPAFQAAVQQGHVGSVMCSYASINGVYSCQNPMLLTDVLNDQWGFQGFVRSDLGAVHDVSAAFNAGLDQVKPDSTATIIADIQNGEIPESRLDDAVERVLSTMFQFGVFNRTSAGMAATDASTAADQATAETDAEQGSVLLQNTGQILPLDTATVGSVAVIGADGGSGAETATTPGSSAYVSASSVVTPFQGIQAAAGSAAAVTYNDGSNLTQAAAAAQAAKVAVVFVNDPQGEGRDLATLDLPNSQDNLISAVAAANPDTVVVINSGGPVTMPWLSQVKGVIEAWYPGQADGSAIAALLFGQVDPSGKLPVSFPQSTSSDPTATAAQYPGTNGEVQYSEGLDVGYRGYDAEGLTPLFPFGFGLSYTTFAFNDLQVSQSNVENQVFDPNAASGTSPNLVTVSARVTNTGDRAGAEVAQLYLGDPPSAGEPPRQLEGFDKVDLGPGQSTEVHFTLDARALSSWETGGGWVVPDGTFQVSVGDSSATSDLPLEGSFQVTRTVGARYVTLAAPTTAAPATTVAVTATFVNDGDDLLQPAAAGLDLPDGWSLASPPTPVRSLAPHQTVTRTYQVRVPEASENTTGTLKAVLSYHAGGGPPGRQQITGTASIQVEPLVTATASQTALAAGASGPATLSYDNILSRPVTVHYQVSAPAGITVTPATGVVTVPPGVTSTTVQVAVASGTPPGDDAVTFALTATDQGRTYPLPTATLPVVVPYPSLAGAFNNVGVTDDTNHTPGNFDGSGNSYSTETLAAAGITPGGTVTSAGLNFTWPNVAAGVNDNVGLLGQPVAVTGSGSELGFLGAAVNATQTFTGSVIYTDGTTGSFTLTFPDWFSSTAPTGDQLVATLPYLNRTNGKPLNPVSLFETSVPINPAKTVAAVVLPNAGTATLDHVFALSIGSPS